MTDYKFSVAISVYKNDSPDFFRRALESITDLQTVKPDEIILVVDGPVGEALNDVITAYEQKYSSFHVIRLPQNGGLGNALRIAVEHCTNELIARMDSDDVSVPTRFEQQLAFFTKHPEADIVGGDITEFVGEEDHIVGKRTVPLVHKDIAEYTKRRCPFNHMSVMYKKASVQKAGGYMDWFCNEDYYLWIRMMEHACVFANTGTVLVNVRTGKDMYKRRGGTKYFRSELMLQNYMLKTGIIGFCTYCVNVAKRFIVQLLLPSRLRGWVFKKIARNST